MWNVFGIAVLLSSFLLVAQAETQDKAQFQEEESVSRGAVIYFYRMKSFTDSMRNPTLYTRGRPLVKLGKKRFFALPVPAGTHYFSWSEQPKKGEEAWVTVNPDQMVFFKVRWREIVPVSEASATRDMRNLAAVESKDIFDSTVERTAPAEMRVALQRRLVVQEVDENISSSERERAELDFDSVRQNPALPRPPAGLEDPPLTHDQLLALLEADIAEELILDKIALSGCQCDTAAAAIITLKGAVEGSFGRVDPSAATAWPVRRHGAPRAVARRYPPRGPGPPAGCVEHGRSRASPARGNPASRR